MKFIKSLLSETHALVWTLAGTGMVLITLSGQTLKYGVWISCIALAVHLAGVFNPWSKKED